MKFVYYMGQEKPRAIVNSTVTMCMLPAPKMTHNEQKMSLYMYMEGV